MMIALVCLLVATASAKHVSVDKIVNGQNANTDETPWYVSLHRNGQFICGGSLLDANWVVTAAHCVDGGDASEYAIIVNPPSTTAMSEFKAVSDVFMHEEYGQNPGFASDDAALLKLADPISGSFNAIALTDTENDYTNDNCEIFGYGYDKQGKFGFVSPNVLQETDGEILSLAECKQAYGNSVTEKNICIDNRKTGSCNGDSGGPMICFPDGVDGGVLAGITSFGVQGCNTRYPSVYTRVSAFRQWLLDTMAAN